MTSKIKNKLNVAPVDYTLNPTYGPMGRKVTPFGDDSAEMQARQAMIPYIKITVKNGPLKDLPREPIEPFPVDLTPIQNMDDLK